MKKAVFQGAVLCVIWVLSACVYGADIVPGVSVDNAGVVKIGKLSIGVIHFDKGWKNYRHQNRRFTPADGFPKFSDGKAEVKGKFKSFALAETVLKTGAHSVDYSLEISHDTGVETEACALAVSLPVESFYARELKFDDKKVKLPEDCKAAMVFSGSKIKRVVIPTFQGLVTFEGNFTVYVQDERKYHGKDFTVRLMMSPAKGKITKASIAVKISSTPYDTVALDISSQANMGFRDEVDGDRKGGWTDQGANDLRMIKAGVKRLGGIDFKILDPSQNGGKSCMVFSGPERDYFLNTAELNVGGKTFERLYLLHAIAWAPSDKVAIGKVNVKYADGSAKEIDVVSGRDVANWWNPFVVKNGSIVWTGENKEAYVGLFLSHFPVDKKPIESVTLNGTGKSVWMVAAVSGGEAVPMKIEQPYYIVPNKEWRPFEHKIVVKPGSALDLSFLNDMPAGKFGDVVIRDGHFEFRDRPGKPVRFYGANTCFSANFQDKKNAENLVNQLARLGYNTIRLHHYDRDVVDRKADKSTVLDKANIDKLDYLFYLSKKNGLYVSIDLYTIRNVKNGEFPGVDAKDIRLQNYKVIAALEDAVLDNWKEFARNLLTHVNPYTGIAWKDDPALFNICVLNEDNLNAHWRKAQDLYEKHFAIWLKDKGITPADAIERNIWFNKFLIDRQTRMYKICRDFLRELGVKAQLSDLNMQSSIALGLVRDHMDYVDNHTYWDHPHFLEKRWSLPFGYKNTQAIKEKASVPRGLMPARLFGKPYAVTEYCYCPPNHFRSEGSVLMGAYAALQDWDVLHHFAYSHRDTNTQSPQAVGGFDIVTDPINLLGERIGTLMFRRGDIASAKTVIPYVFTEKCMEANNPFGWGEGQMPSDYSMLGFVSRIGGVCLAGGKKLPAGYDFAVGVEDVPASVMNGKPYFKADESLAGKLESMGVIGKGLVNAETGVYRSETGEIEMDVNAGSIKVASDRSVGLVIPDKMSMSAGPLSVDNDGGFVTVYAGSLDGKKVTDSSRILVYHLTDVQNTKVKFRDKRHTVMDKRGVLPHLVRRGKAVISLKSAGGTPTVWAIDMAGERIKKMPVEKVDGGFSFVAETVQKEGAFMAYEVVK